MPTIQARASTRAAPTMAAHHRTARSLHSRRRRGRDDAGSNAAKTKNSHIGPNDRSVARIVALTPASHTSGPIRPLGGPSSSGTAAENSAIPAAISRPFGLTAPARWASIGVDTMIKPASIKPVLDHWLSATNAKASSAADSAALISLVPTRPLQLGD